MRQIAKVLCLKNSVTDIIKCDKATPARVFSSFSRFHSLMPSLAWSSLTVTHSTTVIIPLSILVYSYMIISFFVRVCMRFLS